MSDEEYKTYKEKWNGYHCGPQHYYGCGNYYDRDCNDWRKPNAENKNESSTDKIK